MHPLQRMIMAAGLFLLILLIPTTAFATTTTVPGIGGNPIWTALKLLVSLSALICLAILSIRFMAKRTHLGNSEGGMKVLSARQVGPGKSVQVIEVDRRRYLIGVGDQVTLLSELGSLESVKDGVTAESGDAVDFSEMFSQRLRSLRGTAAKGETKES